MFFFNILDKRLEVIASESGFIRDGMIQNFFDVQYTVNI